ncbi:hypothetical protein JCM16303_001130 [Sporobolomyces ruberrimus]
MARRLPPSPLKLIPQTPGQPIPRWPVFIIPSPPPPTFSAPVRTRSLSVGTGVVVGELPGLEDEVRIMMSGGTERKISIFISTTNPNKCNRLKTLLVNTQPSRKLLPTIALPPEHTPQIIFVIKPIEHCTLTILLISHL